MLFCYPQFMRMELGFWNLKMVGSHYKNKEEKGGRKRNQKEHLLFVVDALFRICSVKNVRLIPCPPATKDGAAKAQA